LKDKQKKKLSAPELYKIQPSVLKVWIN